jgi:hypothetical protein
MNSTLHLAEHVALKEAQRFEAFNGRSIGHVFESTPESDTTNLRPANPGDRMAFLALLDALASRARTASRVSHCACWVIQCGNFARLWPGHGVRRLDMQLHELSPDDMP